MFTVFFLQMESRSRRIVQLATKNGNDDATHTNTSSQHEMAIESGNSRLQVEMADQNYPLTDVAMNNIKPNDQMTKPVDKIGK